MRSVHINVGSDYSIPFMGTEKKIRNSIWLTDVSVHFFNFTYPALV